MFHPRPISIYSCTQERERKSERDWVRDTLSCRLPAVVVVVVVMVVWLEFNSSRDDDDYDGEKLEWLKNNNHNNKKKKWKNSNNNRHQNWKLDVEKSFFFSSLIETAPLSYV